MLRARANPQIQAQGLQGGRPHHLCTYQCQARTWTPWGSCPCLGSASRSRQLAAGPAPSSEGDPPPHRLWVIKFCIIKSLSLGACSQPASAFPPDRPGLCPLCPLHNGKGS